MQTVYDAEGLAFVVDSVDAREYVATGRYFRDKPGAEIAPVDVAPAVEKPPVEAVVSDDAPKMMMGAEVFEQALDKVRGKPGPKPKG